MPCKKENCKCYKCGKIADREVDTRLLSNSSTSDLKPEPAPVPETKTNSIPKAPSETKSSFVVYQQKSIKGDSLESMNSRLASQNVSRYSSYEPHEEDVKDTEENNFEPESKKLSIEEISKDPENLLITNGEDQSNGEKPESNEIKSIMEKEVISPQNKVLETTGVQDDTKETIHPQVEHPKEKDIFQQLETIGVQEDTEDTTRDQEDRVPETIEVQEDTKKPILANVESPMQNVVVIDEIENPDLSSIESPVYCALTRSDLQPDPSKIEDDVPVRKFSITMRDDVDKPLHPLHHNESNIDLPIVANINSDTMSVFEDDHIRAPEKGYAKSKKALKDLLQVIIDSSDKILNTLDKAEENYSENPANSDDDNKGDGKDGGNGKRNKGYIYKIHNINLDGLNCVSINLPLHLHLNSNAKVKRLPSRQSEIKTKLSSNNIKTSSETVSIQYPKTPYRSLSSEFVITENVLVNGAKINDINNTSQDSRIDAVEVSNIPDPNVRGSVPGNESYNLESQGPISGENVMKSNNFNLQNRNLEDNVLENENINLQNPDLKDMQKENKRNSSKQSKTVNIRAGLKLPMNFPQQRNMKVCVPCYCEDGCPLFDNDGNLVCPEQCGCCTCPYTVNTADPEDRSELELCRCTSKTQFNTIGRSYVSRCQCSRRVDLCPCRDKYGSLGEQVPEFEDDSIRDIKRRRSTRKSTLRMSRLSKPLLYNDETTTTTTTTPTTDDTGRRGDDEDDYRRKRLRGAKTNNNGHNPNLDIILQSYPVHHTSVNKTKLSIITKARDFDNQIFEKDKLYCKDKNYVPCHCCRNKMSDTSNEHLIQREVGGANPCQRRRIHANINDFNDTVWLDAIEKVNECSRNVYASLTVCENEDGVTPDNVCNDPCSKKSSKSIYADCQSRQSQDCDEKQLSDSKKCYHQTKGPCEHKLKDVFNAIEDLYGLAAEHRSQHQCPSCGKFKQTRADVCDPCSRNKRFKSDECFRLLNRNGMNKMLNNQYSSSQRNDGDQDHFNISENIECEETDSNVHPSMWVPVTDDAIEDLDLNHLVEACATHNIERNESSCSLDDMSDITQKLENICASIECNQFLFQNNKLDSCSTRMSDSTTRRQNFRVHRPHSTTSSCQSSPRQNYQPQYIQKEKQCLNRAITKPSTNMKVRLSDDKKPCTHKTETKSSDCLPKEKSENKCVQQEDKIQDQLCEVQRKSDYTSTLQRTDSCHDLCNEPSYSKLRSCTNTVKDGENRNLSIEPDVLATLKKICHILEKNMKAEKPCKCNFPVGNPKTNTSRLPEDKNCVKNRSCKSIGSSNLSRSSICPDSDDYATPKNKMSVSIVKEAEVECPQIKSCKLSEVGAKSCKTRNALNSSRSSLCQESERCTASIPDNKSCSLFEENTKTEPHANSKLVPCQELEGFSTPKTRDETEEEVPENTLKDSSHLMKTEEFSTPNSRINVVDLKQLVDDVPDIKSLQETDDIPANEAFDNDLESKVNSTSPINVDIKVEEVLENQINDKQEEPEEYSEEKPNVEEVLENQINDKQEEPEEYSEEKPIIDSIHEIERDEPKEEVNELEVPEHLEDDMQEDPVFNSNDNIVEPLNMNSIGRTSERTTSFHSRDCNCLNDGPQESKCFNDQTPKSEPPNKGVPSLHCGQGCYFPCIPLIPMPLCGDALKFWPCMCCPKQTNDNCNNNQDKCKHGKGNQNQNSGVQNFVSSLLCDLNDMNKTLIDCSGNSIPKNCESCSPCPPMSCRPPPSPICCQGYPASIHCVRPLGNKSLMVYWNVHDFRDISGYEIRMDGCMKNRYFTSGHDCAVVYGVDLCVQHEIELVAIPELRCPEITDDEDLSQSLIPISTQSGKRKSHFQTNGSVWTPSVYIYYPAIQ